jgi:hypothetical protein
MKKCSLTTSILIFAAILFAQDQKNFIINPGQAVTQVIPFNEIYCLKSFSQGVVFFKNKTTGGGLLNFSYLTQEILFINPKGDTLALSEPKQVDSVIIGKNVFYNTDEGFVELDSMAGNVFLCRNYFFLVTNKQIVGAYGTPTNSGGNNTSNRFTSDFAASKMVAQDIMTLSKRHTLYAGNRPGNLKAVSKKSLGNVFGKKQNAYSLYIQNNNVNFSSRQDVVQLITYMNQQP